MVSIQNGTEGFIPELEGGDLPVEVLLLMAVRHLQRKGFIC